MPWIRFTDDFDWPMTQQSLTAYKKGMRCLVSQACAASAIGAGKAVEAPAGSGQAPQQDAGDAGT